MGAHRVIWWNVQRLLKPTGSALSRALGATAKDSWTSERYEQKIARLGGLLADVAAGDQPAILALAEVEDASAARAVAAAAGWHHMEVVADAGNELEGDDLVVLFDPAILGVVGQGVSYNVHNRYTTRDLFEMTFATRAGHHFVLVTNHWPSRLISNSEPLRVGLADYCRRVVERALKYNRAELISPRGAAQMPSREKLLERALTPVLVLGDLNDEPFDMSVRCGLDATRDLSRADVPLRLPRGHGEAAVSQYLAMHTPLLNPTWPLLLDARSARGSTHWNGEWYLLDQLVVSRGTLGDGPVRLVDQSLTLHRTRTVSVDGTTVQAASRGGIPIPFDARTASGVSDHLPLTFQLEFD